MSDAEDPSLPKKVLRTVTPGTRGHKDPGMDVIGWSMLVGMLVLLVPLLPFIVIVWLITKVLDRFSGE
ncbi:hypothetical protein ACFQDG_18050 [Natronoarchaeum mannanilyticum]|uniref:Uncharacterized protein n=1 Tax=Natronoarchaeum mannanilyticum TaxID=926360 RepID=A0AAV3T908_9EURY